MNLSLKQKALIQMLTVIVSGVVVGFAVALLFQYFSVTTILIGFGVLGLGYMMYLVYQINLAQLQYKERLRNMTEKKD